MAALEGVTAIGRLLFSLVAISGIALAAIYMVLSAPPVAKPTKTERASRPLAYETAIADPSAAGGEAEAKSDDTPEPPPLPEAKPEPPKAKPKQAATPPQMDLPPDDAGQTAAVPPDGYEEYPGGGEPLPWQTDGHTAAMPNDPTELDDAQGYGQEPPGYGQDGYDPSAEPYDQGQDAFDQAYADQNGGPPPGAYGQPGADPYGRQYGQPVPQPHGQPAPYGQPYGQPGDPYAQQGAAPYGQQGQPGAPGEEWVQVMVSGTGMRSTASEDAPMLFAFPYGRNLRVVSRHNDWIEVADPQSSATGWMKAEMLGPGAPPGQAYQQNEAYYEQPIQEQRRPGLFRKGGFADMIDRAFGRNH